MRTLLGNNAEKYRQQAPAFQRIFGVKLKPFWSNLTGFDIIKFDEEFVQPPDGTSTKDVVQERFGSEGVDMILRLI